MARQSKYSKRRVPGGRTYRRYPENLQTVGDRVFSYGTHVATFKRGKGLVTKGYWSVTTSKHINYIARQWGLTVRKGK
jgi:hypothetical protein